MGNTNTERKKRQKQRRRAKKQGREYAEWLDAALKRKEASAHLSDDNFLGEW